MAAVSTPEPRRLRRIELPAITGVMVRDIVNFSSYWRSPS